MRWSLVAGLVLTAAILAVAGPRSAVGFASGLGWAVANVMAMGWLVRTTLSGARHPWWRLAGPWLVKVPLLYAAGLMMLVAPWSSPGWFLAGFTMWFALLTGRAIREAAA
ncbi:MAG TPA: hypothetical protein VGB20_00695 [bacterium]